MKRITFLLCVLFLSLSNVYAQDLDLDLNLSLKSHAVMVYDAQNNETIYDKNVDNIMPIASITKLMMAMVVLDAKVPLDEKITIQSADIDTLKKTRSRLQVGASLARHELLHLALMSSENRAAAALGRAFPGGVNAFVDAMNNKARELEMHDSYFVEPTGLSAGNVSTARDLAKMVSAAYQYNEIRYYSTTTKHVVKPRNRKRRLHYANTNGLLYSDHWKIDVSKTGFLNEAGRCLVMRAKVAGKPVVIVLLNSWGKNTRIGDANRVRKWMEVNYSHNDA